MRRQKSPRKKPLDPIGSAVSPLHLVPSHPSTVTPTGNAGFTSCEYGGTTVKSIDPKGKWKKFENDALGHLVRVREPRPGGGPDFETLYA